MIVLSGISLAIAFVFGLGANLFESISERLTSEGRFIIIAISSSAASVFAPFAIGAIAVVQTILVVVRFYKAVASDEAYLTYTLPVSESVQFWSRFLVLLVYCAIALLTMFVGFFIFFLIDYGWESVLSGFRNFLGLIAADEANSLLIISIAALFPIKITSEFAFNILAASKIARRGKFGVAVGITVAMYYVELFFYTTGSLIIADCYYLFSNKPATLIMAFILTVMLIETALFLFLSDKFMRKVDVN